MEPPKSSFQGALSFDTRFLKWLITFSTVLNNTTNAMTNKYEAALERRGFKAIFSVSVSYLGNLVLTRKFKSGGKVWTSRTGETLWAIALV